MKTLVQNMSGIWFQAFLSLLAYTFLLYLTPRQNFVQFFSLYTILFIGFYLLWKKLDLKQGLGLSLAFRILALFALPSLSDDYFRFVWDGAVWLEGINPYEFTPKELLETEKLSGAHWKEWYGSLNSQNYYSVYPPLNQFLFASATYLFGTNSIYWSVFGLKLFIFMAEIGTLFFLPKVLKSFGVSSKNALLYSLNPLVVIELTGNCHFEGVMVFFLALFLWLRKKKKIALAAIGFAAAVSIKLIPLLFLPLFIRSLKPFKWLGFSFLVLLINVLLFLPFATPDFIAHFSSSLDLYFQSFQFNSFFYSIFHDLLPPSIKPFTGMFILIFPLAALAWFSFSKSSMLKNLPAKMGMSQAFYYFFSSVVHPWYLSTVLLFNAFHPVKYILVWSYAIGLSYFTYRVFPYEEAAILVALEYLVVFTILFIDWVQLKRQRFSE